MELSVTKEGVKFSTSGDIGSANVICRQSSHVDKKARLALHLPKCLQRGACRLTACEALLAGQPVPVRFRLALLRRSRR